MYTDRICHLCRTHYSDSIYFADPSAHTPQECLAVLEYKLNCAEENRNRIRELLVRAQEQYHLKPDQEAGK